MRDRQHVGDLGRRVRSRRMSPAASALQVAFIVFGHVEDDVVILSVGVHTAGHAVKVEPGTNLPSDNVVCHRSIATYPDGTEQHAVSRVEGQSTTEDVDATDLAGDHRIVL